MVCPKCYSSDVNVQAISETKKRGCLGTFLWILLAICTCGLILLIPLLRGKKSKTVQYAVCQHCGHKWKITKAVRSENVDYVLICDTCGKDFVSTSKKTRKCAECAGTLVFSGVTKNEWVTYNKEERQKMKAKILKAIEKTSGIICANCGKEVSAAAKFCPHCGKDPKQKALREIPRPHLEDKPSTETPPIIPAAAKTACPHCGKMISETAAFCPYCGNDPKKVIAPAPVKDDRTEVESEERIYCPHCGNSIKASAAFCPYCSKDVRRESKKTQLIVNTSKMPELEIPSGEEKADAIAEHSPEIEQKLTEEIPQPDTTKREETDAVKDEAIEEVYRGKHLKPEEEPKQMEEHADKEDPEELTETKNDAGFVIPESTAGPGKTVVEQPVVVVPKKKGLAPPSDLD